MAIKYKLDKKFDALSAFHAEYEAWFLGAVQAALYGTEKPTDVAGFIRWAQSLDLANIDHDKDYQAYRERLIKEHEELLALVNGLKNPLEAADFKKASKALQFYLSNIRDFYQLVTLEGWGMDVLTGLKNKHILHGDLTIELERLSREGSPFCIGLVRIDEFEHIEKALDHEKTKDVINTVGKLIYDSLRSYDDAYRVSRDHFILCLKQSDIVGGQKALERLRNVMESATETYTIDGQKKLISLSCCVGAPLPDDDIDDLIDNLYTDLDHQIKDPGSVLTYQELSPLQRFIEKEKT